MFKTVLRQLFASFDEPLKRTPYAVAGFALALLKYFGDAILISKVTLHAWMPLDYLDPFKMPLLHRIEHAPFGISLALMLWMVPFLWIGVVFTMRRALDAGWSPWWALVFLVPYVNYVLMAALCLWPSSEKYAVDERYRDPLEEGPFAPNAALGVVAGTIFALVMIGLAVVLKGNYAFGLFVGTPVGMGAFAGYFAARDFDPKPSELLALSFAVNVIAATVLLLVAFEGVICILMAFPISLLLGWFGAFVGREIAMGGRAIRKSAASAMFLIPLFTLVEPAHLAGHQLHVVNSAIEINASPAAVWPHLIEFQPIAAPKELTFRVGVAYPTWSHTDGSGIGAMRYCEFSTGAVAEQVTAWDPGKRLAFDVITQPAPMVELTPFANVQPRHLHGYVRSKQGEFRLVPLPKGRTRLEGTSSYELDIAPENYWSLWVDASVHAIHMRVFEHIKHEVESGASATHSPGGGELSAAR
jgi:uncharacterized membrane protein YhaH (DUF805 family)